MCSRSSRARSCCKNQYLVTPTFAPLTRNTWSRAQYMRTQWFLFTFVLGRAMIARQPQMLQMSAVGTGQMSAVEIGQTTAAETSVLSQQKTVKKHRIFVCLSSRPPIPFERGEGQCHQVLIFTTTSRPQAPRTYPPPRPLVS